jgi:IS5 family transposase
MQVSFSDLEYTAKKKMTRRDRFLGEIDKVTPWSALVAEIEPFYPKGEGRGRPPIGLKRMLRMYIAQQCFGLSDEGIEDALYDNQAIRGFVGITHTLVTTPANTHDVTQAHALLHGEERIAFGDAGYQGVEKQRENLNTQVEWEVAMRPGKRRALPDTPLGRIHEQIEKLKASVRAKVEHPFHVVKNRFGMRKVRYKGLAENAAQLFTLFGLANLLIAKRRLFALSAQGAS